MNWIDLLDAYVAGDEGAVASYVLEHEGKDSNRYRKNQAVHKLMLSFDKCGMSFLSYPIPGGLGEARQFLHEAVGRDAQYVYALHCIRFLHSVLSDFVCRVFDRIGVAYKK